MIRQIGHQSILQHLHLVTFTIQENPGIMVLFLTLLLLHLAAPIRVFRDDHGSPQKSIVQKESILDSFS